MRYIDLKESAINPNRAKFWAVGLSFVAALVAMLTIKSNFDYFAQYFEGFGFWMRVIPFFAVEAMIICLPLSIGWGNRNQIIAAGVVEVLLIVLSLLHTSLVGQSIQTKQIAEKTKAAASADLKSTQETAAAIAARNAAAQAAYAAQMVAWRRAAYTAQQLGQPAPPAPQAPQLESVPVISESLVSNATMNIEAAAEGAVGHAFLLRLLYAMIATVILGSVVLVKLADSVRVRNWLLAQRADEISHAIESTQGARDVVMQLPFPAPSPVAQNRIGFNPMGAKTQPKKDTDTKTHKDCIGDQQSLCLSRLRHRLRQVSKNNFGVSFKADPRGAYVFVRAMAAEQGSQVTQATLKLTAEQVEQLANQSELAAQSAIVQMFAEKDLALKY